MQYMLVVLLKLQPPLIPSSSLYQVDCTAQFTRRTSYMSAGLAVATFMALFVDISILRQEFDHMICDDFMNRGSRMQYIHPHFSSIGLYDILRSEAILGRIIEDAGEQIPSRKYENRSVRMILFHLFSESPEGLIPNLDLVVVLNIGCARSGFHT